MSPVAARGPRHTWLNRIVEDLINSLDILVRRRVQHNDDSSDQANGTPQFAQRPQLFIEEVGPQHGAYQHSQSTQWGDKDCWREGVRCEVAYLSENH